MRYVRPSHFFGWHCEDPAMEACYHFIEPATDDRGRVTGYDILCRDNTRIIVTTESPVWDPGVYCPRCQAVLHTRSRGIPG